jgi:hypothetical protein
MEKAKLSIMWENKSIIIEGPADFVEAQAKFFARSVSKPLAHESEYETKSGLSAASLIADKKPRGHGETVAVLAFYLSEQGANEFTEDEMRRAYIQAKVRPPKVIGQAIRDAKNKYDFIESTKNRGTYRLSAHGDRTVRFDLPRTSP